MPRTKKIIDPREADDQINIKLPRALMTALRELSEQRGIGISTLVREAVGSLVGQPELAATRGPGKPPGLKSA